MVTTVKKEKAFSACVDFLHNLCVTRGIEILSNMEEVKSACFSCIKTGKLNSFEMLTYIESVLPDVVISVKFLNDNHPKFRLLSNGKTILEMTEDEYLETTQGSLDVFATEYAKIQQQYKPNVFVKKEPVFDAQLESKIKDASKISKDIHNLTSHTRKEGFECLGYVDGINYIWSNLRQSLFTLGHKDLVLNNFLNMFGKNFLKNNYTTYNDKAKPFINTQDLAGDIIEGCVDAGVFNLKKMFGFGIFVDPMNKDHLIVNGTEIWGTNPNFKGDRIYSKNVYTNIKDLDFSKDTPVATPEEFKEWFEFLGSWNYKRGEQDQLLNFGWSLVAPFAGCVNWRTHYSLTGDKGSGKTTLQTSFGNFMGEFALNIDGESSEAGIRQKVGSSSCVVIIDEAESNSRKIANTLTFLRTASSSGTILKGTQDQNGMDFILKITGMIGGIVAPALQPADQRRFLKIELLEKGEKIHPLLVDIERQRDIGKKCIMYIIQNYKMFKSVCKKVRAVLLKDNDSSAYADSLTTIVAGAYIGLNHNDDTKGIEEFLKKFDFDKEKSAIETKDHYNLLNKILKSELRDENGSHSIIELINGSFNSNNNPDVKKQVKRTLGRNGIKVEEDKENYQFYISTKDENFLKILKYSKFDSGDILSVLSRIKEAEIIQDSVMIGGVRQARSSVLKIALNKQDYTFTEEDKK